MANFVNLLFWYYSDIFSISFLPSLNILKYIKIFIFFFFLFFFGLYMWHMEVLGPGIKSGPLTQCWTLNPLCHSRNSFLFFFSFFLFFFFFFVFLGLHSWHMEVPRLGVQSELWPLAYPTATAIWDLSHICGLHHSYGNTGSLTHLVRPGIKPTSSWILVGFVNLWAMMGTPETPKIFIFSSLSHYSILCSICRFHLAKCCFCWFMVLVVCFLMSFLFFIMSLCSLEFFEVCV